MNEKETYNIGQRALLRRVDKLKISKEEKAEVVKFAELVFKVINAK